MWQLAILLNVENFAIPDQTAVTCVRTLLYEVLPRYGICDMLHKIKGKTLGVPFFRNILEC